MPSSQLRLLAESVSVSLAVAGPRDDGIAAMSERMQSIIALLVLTP